MPKPKQSPLRKPNSKRKPRRTKPPEVAPRLQLARTLSEMVEYETLRSACGAPPDAPLPQPETAVAPEPSRAVETDPIAPTVKGLPNTTMDNIPAPSNVYVISHLKAAGLDPHLTHAEHKSLWQRLLAWLVGPPALD